MPEMQVVINVHGGLVQEVFASEPLAELVVVDWDVTPGDHQAVEVEVGQNHLRASVQHPIVQPIEHLAGSDVEAVIEAVCDETCSEDGFPIAACEEASQPLGLPLAIR